MQFGDVLFFCINLGAAALVVSQFGVGQKRSFLAKGDSAQANRVSVHLEQNAT